MMAMSNTKKLWKTVFCLCLALLFSSHVAAADIAEDVIQFESYWEYRWYLALSDVPDHLITFDQINLDGTFNFKQFRMAKETRKENFDNYTYDFTLDNGFGATLAVKYVYHYTHERTVIDLPEGVEDVRDFQATAECRDVRIDDIEYGFVKDGVTGEYTLYRVTMEIDNIQFSWYMNDPRYPSEIDFPNDSNSFMERLLHASTATQARDEFAAAIRGGRPSQLGWRILFVATPVVVVGGASALFVIRKKKVKAKESA